MRRLITILVIAIVVVGGGIAVARQLSMRRSRVSYITRTVGYADITATVSETGTVNPVNVIQVGTQVSGTINVLNVDYNSKVKTGEILATLDPTTFQASVSQDQANVAAAQSTASADQNQITSAQTAIQTANANLAQMRASLASAQANVVKAKETLSLANVTVQRDQQLLAQGYIPQNQMDTDKTAAETDASDLAAAQAAVQVAQAQVVASESQLQTARVAVGTAQSQAAAAQHQAAANQAQLAQAQYNLSQTIIRSPVDGIVMARNVTVGQTVAASLSTPTLFNIATSLTDMQVDTSVDEADVGTVAVGEQAQISVTAYPNVTFNGTVQQVRINPTTVQNVVTYDAVVTVHDTSGRLFPGMTAQVTIDTGTRSHVLAVPIAAVLYRPIFGGAGGGGAAGGALVQAGTNATQGPGGGAPVAGAPGSTVTVWTLTNGRPTPVHIVIGLSDNQNIEVRSGSLQQGDPVIIAQRTGSAPRGGGRSGGAGGAGGSSGGQSGGSGGQSSGSGGSSGGQGGSRP